MNKYLLFIVVILSLIAILMSSTEKSTTHFLNEEIIKVKKENEILEIDMEEYVIGVVAAEMPASWNDEALKAQAIASRTYALYKIEQNNNDYDVLASIKNQGYLTEEEMKNKWKDEYDKYYNKIKKAVIETKDLVLKYNNELIESFYFAMSNGFTESSELVFNQEKDYLVSVRSDYETNNLNGFETIINFTKEEFCQKLNLNCSSIVISDISRSSTHRINNITINNKKFKGTEIRTLLGLRSTDFKISVNDNVTITTYGYGHGVGMSQTGANEMAKNGYMYDEILKHYYKDVEIVKYKV